MNRKHTHADHANIAVFWHSRLGHLEGVISRVALGVSACFGVC